MNLAEVVLAAGLVIAWVVTAAAYFASDEPPSAPPPESGRYTRKDGKRMVYR